MRRWVYCSLLLVLGMLTLHPMLAFAQSGSICVLAFEDANKNGLRDANELPLPKVNVTLAVQGDIIIQSYITTQENAPYCFEGLADGTYSLTFEDSPAHNKTTQNAAEVPVTSGSRMRVEFGAVAVSPFGEDETATPANDTAAPKMTSRLILAAMGAALVMLFMAGLGAVITFFMS